MATPTSSGGEANGPACGTSTSTGSGGDVPDATPPIVTITHPPPGQILGSAGNVHLTYVVEDESCIVSATLLVDGGTPTPLEVPPYEANLTGLPWGTHDITVQVVDEAGNAAISAPVTIRVCSGPDRPW